MREFVEFFAINIIDLYRTASILPISFRLKVLSEGSNEFKLAMVFIMDYLLTFIDLDCILSG
jgi:hypothetical protein